METQSFNGSVQISVNTSQAGSFSYLNLHAASTLTVLSSEVINVDTGAVLALKRNFTFAPNSFWVLQLESPVSAQQIELNFTFSSKLATDMYGFYVSEYFNPAKNETVKLASTQFQVRISSGLNLILTKLCFLCRTRTLDEHSRVLTSPLTNQHSKSPCITVPLTRPYYPTLPKLVRK